MSKKGCEKVREEGEKVREKKSENVGEKVSEKKREKVGETWSEKVGVMVEKVGKKVSKGGCCGGVCGCVWWGGLLLSYVGMGCVCWGLVIGVMVWLAWLEGEGWGLKVVGLWVLKVKDMKSAREVDGNEVAGVGLWIGTGK